MRTAIPRSREATAGFAGSTPAAGQEPLPGPARRQGDGKQSAGRQITALGPRMRLSGPKPCSRVTQMHTDEKEKAMTSLVWAELPAGPDFHSGLVRYPSVDGDQAPGHRADFSEAHAYLAAKAARAAAAEPALAAA